MTEKPRARWTKLPDDSWGCWVRGAPPDEGEKVTVVSREGWRQNAVIGSVLRSGHDGEEVWSLCMCEKDGPRLPPSPERNRKPWERDEGPVNAFARKWLLAPTLLLLAAVLSPAFCGYALEWLNTSDAGPATVATDAAVTSEENR